MSASEHIESATCEKMLTKNISFDLDLDEQEEKTLVFVLGCSISDKENLDLIKTYYELYQKGYRIKS